MNSETSIVIVSNTYYVKIMGVRNIGAENIPKLIHNLRELSSVVKVQCVHSHIVFGMNHLMRVIEITLELWSRGIRISRSLETDLLMRLCCTDQISKAIGLGGLKKGQPGCFILISQDKNSILEVETLLRGHFTSTSMSVLRPGKRRWCNWGRGTVFTLIKWIESTLKILLLNEHRL
ncbi:MAG: KEOPS complex subunit Cgi121 [Candidatus Eiseniibacteriota bacterium]